MVSGRIRLGTLRKNKFHLNVALSNFPGYDGQGVVIKRQFRVVIFLWHVLGKQDFINNDVKELYESVETDFGKLVRYSSHTISI